MRSPRKLLTRILLIVGMVAALSACLPPPPPAGLDAKTQAAVDFYPDSAAGIRHAFARFGPAVQDCALRYAARESGLWPLANNGTYFGILQMHAGWQGSIDAAAAELGRWPSFFDPWVAALAASYGFQTQGWRAWRPAIAGCA